MKRETRLFDELSRFAGASQITHALALTYTYDGDVAWERLWMPLIRRFGLAQPLVVADAVGSAGSQLGVRVVKVRPGKGVFHPKLLLAIKEGGVFVALGSANLTKGGLGASLELVSTLEFGRETDRPSDPALLDSILDWLERGVLSGMVAGRAAESFTHAALDVIRYARVVREPLKTKSGKGATAFFTSSKRSIWEQLVEWHGGDPLRHLTIVSPFLEADQPPNSADGTLFAHALGSGLPWVAKPTKPRITLLTCYEESAARFPANVLNELADEVEVHRQRLSHEPRRLHAKLFVLEGEQFTTVLWGSPNFSPAALLRSQEAGGNVECALAVRFKTQDYSVEDLLRDFDLPDTFVLAAGPLQGAEAPAVAPGAPLMQIGELLYDPVAQTLSVFGEVLDERVKWIELEVVGETSMPLGRLPVEGMGLFNGVLSVPTLRVEDLETGYSRLAGTTVLARMLDEGEAEIEAVSVRLNVQFEHALEVWENLLLGAAALSADALLVPTLSAPEERVAAVERLIERRRAARREGAVDLPSHQATLDRFFRNVRVGLDKRQRNLKAARGSRFALMGWSAALRKSLSADPGDGDPARRAYFVRRVAEHVVEVLDMLPTWYSEAHSAATALDAARLAQTLESVQLERGDLLEDLIAPALRAQSNAVARLREVR